MLSPEEKTRADAYGNAGTRERFVVTRTALRCLLARSLGIVAGDVKLICEPGGKPRLADPSSSLEFSVSGSHDRAAVAITEGCRIGVDIEKSRSLPDLEGLSRQVLSAIEVAAFDLLPHDERPVAFLQYWTCKEALAKALGLGFGLPFESFSIGIGRDGSTRLVQAPEGEQAADWTLTRFEPEAGYYAAVAYRDRERPIRIEQASLEAILIR
jgi:4'-phosphopantetheinyl transferase